MYRLSVKKKKGSREHWDKNKNKAKFYNLSFTRTSQPCTQASKKNKYNKNRWEDYLATKINITKVVKKTKNKNKAKNLNYIKYYTRK